MRIVNALVDYDNVYLAARPEQRRDDVAANLAELLNALSIRTLSLIPDCRDLLVRLYGGWFDRGGRMTPRAAWLLEHLPAFRTRMNSIRVLPRLATSLVAYPDVDLIATHRADLNVGQKMVDTMLTADAIILAAQAEQILIVSDDEDFTPAMIAGFFQGGRRAHMMVIVRRRRNAGDAPNDDILLDRLLLTITNC